VVTDASSVHFRRKGLFTVLERGGTRELSARSWLPTGTASQLPSRLWSTSSTVQDPTHGLKICRATAAAEL
jgi:hypothetical protein